MLVFLLKSTLLSKEWQLSYDLYKQFAIHSLIPADLEIPTVRYCQHRQLLRKRKPSTSDKSHLPTLAYRLFLVSKHRRHLNSIRILPLRVGPPHDYLAMCTVSPSLSTSPPSLMSPNHRDTTNHHLLFISPTDVLLHRPLGPPSRLPLPTPHLHPTLRSQVWQSPQKVPLYHVFSQGVDRGLGSAATRLQIVLWGV